MMEETSQGKMNTVKSLVLTAFGGYDKIAVKQTPYPDPGEYEITVEMKACGLNFCDLYTRQGLFTFHNIKPPFILGCEGAGIVHKLGDKVTEFKVGDRVMCWNFTYGMWTEFASVPVNQCFPIPENMTFEEAASIPINYLTAYFVLFDFGYLRPGQSLLIQAAAGGVGWATTQLANTVENVTVFGTASACKHEYIRNNGVTHAIDYHSVDFVQEVLKVSPTGVNIVLDCLSGADFVKAQSLLKHMGRLIHIGISNMISGEKRNLLQAFKVWWQTKNISILNLIQKNQAICGFNMGTLSENDPRQIKYALGKIVDLYDEGKIKPRIDSVWSFDQVVEATKCMVNRKNIGKLVLLPKVEKQDNLELHVSQAEVCEAV